MEKVINKKILILLPLLLLSSLFSGCFLTPSVNQALVRNITQNTDYTLIQAALDAANSGDIIEVYDGTYNENIIFPDNMVITLRSVSGASSTIIEGDDGSETVRCNGSLDGTTLQGFTITHASGIGNGIYISYSLNNYLTISSCTISGNTAYFYGGGIVNEGILTIIGSTISGNIAPESGGGIVNEGTLTVTGSNISGNTATENGGGIYNKVESGSCILTVTGGSTISGNNANFGGGISNQGTLTVTGGSTISGNGDADTGYGGGIFNYYLSGSASTIVNGGSTISGNTADLGGGIYNEEILTVTGSFIFDNDAISDAGGIYLYTDADVIIGGIGDFNIFTDNKKNGVISADQHIRYTNRDCHTDTAYLNNTFVPN